MNVDNISFEGCACPWCNHVVVLPVEHHDHYVIESHANCFYLHKYENGLSTRFPTWQCTCLGIKNPCVTNPDIYCENCMRCKLIFADPVVDKDRSIIVGYDPIKTESMTYKQWDEKVASSGNWKDVKDKAYKFGHIGKDPNQKSNI